jgi:hypothetical protein
MHYALDVTRAGIGDLQDFLNAIHHALGGVARRRGDLRKVESPRSIVDQDDIGEGATYVNTNPHSSTSPSVQL